MWNFWNTFKRDRFKHLAKEGEIASRTALKCVRFNALRVLLNTVHVFCFLTCIWFVVMLCGLVALLVLLHVSGKTADGALAFIQTAEMVRPSALDLDLTLISVRYVLHTRCMQHANSGEAQTVPVTPQLVCVRYI